MATLSKSLPRLPRRKSPLLTAQQPVAAAQAKARLLELLDTVDREGETITITKRGRPVAQLVPFPARRTGSIFGCMKGTARITGDIVGPEPDLWEAMQ